MPELPEVEQVRRGLEEALVGRKLLRFETTRKDLRWPIPIRALRSEVGRRVAAVRRRGKWLRIEFEAPAGGSALVHLGMSGRVLVASKRKSTRADLPWELHEHWRMSFGTRLVRGIDPRRFGAVLHEPRSQVHPRLADLGPEPLDPSFDAEALRARARHKRASLKSFLLDGRNVTGVGNIYACEACFGAGLRPGRSVARLTRADWTRLHASIRATLERAIASGGTSLRDYVDSAGESGRNQFDLFVYGRAGEPCRHCGSRVQQTRQNGRSTFYCRECQR